MKFPVYFCLIFFLFAAISADLKAQTGFSAINFNSTLNHFNDKNTNISRPRIIVDKDKAKLKNSSPRTVFELEREAFNLINEKRREKGLEPLEWNEQVAKVARLHSQDMAKNKFFSHSGNDGSDVSERADKIGLNRWRAIGENIAYNRGYEQPIEFAVERWMQSPKHKQNLLNKEWRQSAIGIAVTEEGTYYLTQVFILK